MVEHQLHRSLPMAANSNLTDDQILAHLTERFHTYGQTNGKQPVVVKKEEVQPQLAQNPVRVVKKEEVDDKEWNQPQPVPASVAKKEEQHTAHRVPRAPYVPYVPYVPVPASAPAPAPNHMHIPRVNSDLPLGPDHPQRDRLVDEIAVRFERNGSTVVHNPNHTYKCTWGVPCHQSLSPVVVNKSDYWMKHLRDFHSADMTSWDTSGKPMPEFCRMASVEFPMGGSRITGKIPPGLKIRECGDRFPTASGFSGTHISKGKHLVVHGKGSIF